MWSCKNSKKFNNSLSLNKLSNYNFFDKYLYIKGGDSIFIKKFQGVGIDNTVYLNFIYRSNTDSILFVIEKASLDLRFKYFALKNLPLKRKNILLSQCFIDSVHSFSEVNFYRLKTYCYKNYNKLNDSKISCETSPIIKVERFNKNVKYSITNY